MVSRSYKPVKDDRSWRVSHTRKRYTKHVFTSFPYNFTDIEQLVQTSIYKLSWWLPRYRTIESSWWNYWISGNPRWRVVDWASSLRFTLATVGCVWSVMQHSHSAPDQAGEIRNEGRGRRWSPPFFFNSYLGYRSTSTKFSMYRIC
jgi:hypothetical protein